MFLLSQLLYIRKLSKTVVSQKLICIANENSADNNTNERKRCKQEIIWFNPTRFFSKLVEKEILYIKYLTKICLKLAIIVWVI